MTDNRLEIWTKKYCLDISKDDDFSHYQLRILKAIIMIVSQQNHIDTEPTLRQVFLFMNNNQQDYILDQINTTVKEECLTNGLDDAYYEQIKDVLYHTLYVTVYLSPWFRTEETA